MPSVMVYYTDDIDIHSGKKFVDLGMQIAAGVSLKCNEPKGFRTFQMGLFGIDKLKDIGRTVTNLGRIITDIL